MIESCLLSPSDVLIAWTAYPGSAPVAQLYWHSPYTHHDCHCALHRLRMLLHMGGTGVHLPRIQQRQLAVQLYRRVHMHYP
jgi:hypothetical protein